jgi:hypothetical protein
MEESMSKFSERPAQNGLANPEMVLATADMWFLAAEAVLNVMADGGDLELTRSNVIGNTDGSFCSTVDALDRLVSMLTQWASDRYPWFDPWKFRDFHENVEAWRAGIRSGEALSRARFSLFKIARPEAARVSMTAYEEGLEVLPATPIKPGKIFGPNTERNAWLYDQCVNFPRKTYRAIRGEAKTANKEWILKTDQHLIRAVKCHCNSNGIEIPKRKNTRTKPD